MERLLVSEVTIKHLGLKMHKVLQKISNIFSPVYLRIRYYKKRDPFVEFKKLSCNQETKLVSNRTLLLVPIRVSPVSNLFEGLIGYYYKIKGWKVVALVCNQSSILCDNIASNDKHRRMIMCSLCKAEQKRFIDSFGFEQANIEIANKKLVQGYKSKVRFNKSFEPLNEILPGLSKCVESAVIRYTLKSEVNWDADWEIIEQYIQTALNTYVSTKKHVEAINPDLAIISHGVYSQWGVATEVLTNHSVSTYVWARGYIGQGSLLFGKNSSYLSAFNRESKALYQSLSYSNELIENALEYFKEKSNSNSGVDYLNYYQIIDNKNSQIDNISEFKKRFKVTLGMFTNIPWDGQIFNTTAYVPNTRKYLEKVLGIIKASDKIGLIIRAHPAEADAEEGRGSEKIIDILNALLPKPWPQNILYLDPKNPVSSYDVIDLMDVGVVYGSSIGLEIVLRNKPVIQFGKFYTSGKDIVNEVNSDIELNNYVLRMLDGKLEVSAKQLNNAILFATYWHYYRHIADDTVILKRLVFSGFGFESIKELMNSRTLSIVSRQMNNNNEVLNNEICTD